MNALTLSFENRPITVLSDEDGNPWWIAADVCAVLELGNPRSSLALLDDEERGVHTVDTLGGHQQMTIINESGLYSLILRSRKPEAKRFKKWVTSEVLPSIRKTGGYHVSSSTTQPHHPAASVDLSQMTAAMTQMMAPFIQAQMGVVRELAELVLKLKQDEGHRHYPAPYPIAPPVEPAVNPAVEPAEAPGPRAELARKGGLARATKGVRGPDGRFVKAT